MTRSSLEQRLERLEHATATQPPVITEIIVHLPGVDPEVPLRDEQMLLGGRWIRYCEIGEPRDTEGDADAP